MTYISTLERKALAEGRREGLLSAFEFGLKLKFGDAGLALLPAISQITEPEVLEKLLATLADCNSLADFEQAIPQT